VTLLCAYQVGLADGGLRMAAAYTSERRQFGRPIATFQAVAMRAADSYIDLDAMRWTTYEAALALAAGEEGEEQVAVAKWWAAEGGHRVLSIALDLHGGLGVDLDYPIHRYFLHGKQAQLAFGGSGPQLERLWQALEVRAEAAA
jgi:3-oxocholest-4-en-26-oyl-CoA dehydrogenase beta subunit